MSSCRGRGHQFARRRPAPRAKPRRQASRVGAGALLRVRAGAGVHALRAADGADPVRADRRARRARRCVARVLAVVGLRARQRGGVHHRRRARRAARRGCESAGGDAERRGCSVAFALLFVVLALSMFGLYELQLPAALRARLGAASDRQRGGSWVGVAAMGALSALIVGPCVAPPLMGAVLYIAQSAGSGVRRRGLVPAGAGHGRAAGGFRRRRRARDADERAVDGRGAARVRLRVPRAWRSGCCRACCPRRRRWRCGACSRWARRRGRSRSAARPRSKMAARFAGLVLAVVGAAQLLGAFAGAHDPLQPLAGLRGAQQRSDRVQADQVGGRSRSRDRRRRDGRQAAAARLLCRLVRELQGDGEVHLHRSRGARGACAAYVLLQGRCHRQRRASTRR